MGGIRRVSRLRVEQDRTETLTRERLIEECWLTLEEAAHRHETTVSSLKSMIGLGRVYPPPVHTGRGWRINPLFFVAPFARTVAESRQSDMTKITNVRRRVNGAPKTITRVQVTTAGVLRRDKVKPLVQKKKRTQRLPESWLPAARRPQPQAPAKTGDGQDSGGSSSSA